MVDLPEYLRERPTPAEYPPLVDPQPLLPFGEIPCEHFVKVVRVIGAEPRGHERGGGRSNERHGPGRTRIEGVEKGTEKQRPW